MGKRNITISVEDSIHDQAKQRSFNISSVCEMAIKEKLNLKDVVVNTQIRNCEFCGKEFEHATKNINGLTWLFPDEKWVCPRCLLNTLLKSDRELIGDNQELFFEAKSYWDANFKDILKDEKNKHLRR